MGKCFEKQCVYRRTCSLETPLWDAVAVETSVLELELLILSLAGLLRKISPRASRSQDTGWITGCLSPAKIMAVRRAGNGLTSSDGISRLSDDLEESPNAGDIKRTRPCAERQSEAHKKPAEGKHRMLTDLCNAKGYGAEKQCEPNLR